ncbi:MAG: acyl carrier protein [Lachnospiraceae bacterium]|nr:acyl carrier protein [Lachnospiraceae bacterium]
MKEKIREIIGAIDPSLDLSDPDLNLAEDMDSLDIIALMAELEDAFDIEITMVEKTEENFENVDTLCEMVERLS